jgi:hypothetical protein
MDTEAMFTSAGRAMSKSRIVLLSGCVLFSAYLAYCFVTLEQTSANLIFQIRVVKERTLASRLALPDWVFNSYWHTLGEGRLRRAARNDFSFINDAEGTWLIARDGEAFNADMANQLLTYYVCVHASNPKTRPAFVKFLAEHPARKKLRLTFEACDHVSL